MYIKIYLKHLKDFLYFFYNKITKTYKINNQFLNLSNKKLLFYH